MGRRIRGSALPRLSAGTVHVIGDEHDQPNWWGVDIVMRRLHRADLK